MTNRFYLRAPQADVDDVVLIPTSWSAGWSDTTQGANHSLYTGTKLLYLGYNGLTASGVNPNSASLYRFMYGPLSAQVIGGTFKGVVMGRTAVSGDNATFAFALKVVDSSGNDRGTLLPLTYTTNATYQLPVAASTVTSRRLRDINDNTEMQLTAVSVTAGDYLVFEIGFYWTGVTTNAAYMGASQCTANDLLENDSQTGTALNSWIEFSRSIEQGLSWQWDNCTPEDNVGAFNTADPTAAIRWLKYAPGDLIVLVAQRRAASATLTISETGGQTWTSETAISATNQTARVFWCEFNGNMTADPTVSFGATTCNSLKQMVFSAYGRNTKWSVNQALVELDIAAAATHTITGQTTTGTDPEVLRF